MTRKNTHINKLKKPKLSRWLSRLIPIVYPRAVSSWPLVTATPDRQAGVGGGQPGCRSGLNCNWDDVHSAWSLLWCDGEVLRHSAALSCWHRRMGGLGSPWKARVRLDHNWIGPVQSGLPAPRANERSLRRREGRWEEHVGRRQRPHPQR